MACVFPPTTGFSARRTPFPVGTTVYAFPQAIWAGQPVTPKGTPILEPPGDASATAVVAADSGVEFTGLDYSTRYYLGGQVGGEWRYVFFRTAPPPDRPGGHFIGSGGTLIPVEDRPLLDFQGDGVTVADDPDNCATVITVEAGGEGDPITVQDHGVDMPVRSTLEIIAGADSAGVNAVWAVAGPDKANGVSFIPQDNFDHCWLPLDAPDGTDQFTAGGGGAPIGQSGGWTFDTVDDGDPVDLLIPPEPGYYHFGFTVPYLDVVGLVDGAEFEATVYVAWPTGAVYGWFSTPAHYHVDGEGQHPALSGSGFGYLDPAAEGFSGPKGIGVYLDFSNSSTSPVTDVRFAASALTANIPLLWAFKVGS